MITKPTIIVLVGITGDLSKRKLLPALEGLKQQGILPEKFKLVGVTRRDDSELFKMDLDNAADYLRLKAHLEDIEKEWAGEGAGPAQRLFYLSVAPTVSMPIIKHLGESGLATVPDTKLMLEKPFGTDLENGVQLIADIGSYFSDEQVYRIDHYLQKDSVRALTAQTIDRVNVAEIEVYAREQIGIEGRGDFYEQTGALRDFVQSHLLEVAAMVIGPAHRLEVLKNISIPTDKPITEYVKRAQYKGYREAVMNPASTVETFVSVLLHHGDLSVVLKTGKALDRKSTDVTFFFKDGATKVVSLNDAHNAYEHVFEDAMNGDKTFFVSKEEVMANWQTIAPIQDAWKKDSADLLFYDQGSIL